MKSNALIIIIYTVCSLLTITCWGQANLSVTTPIIWSDVKVKDNWTPPTAVNYKEYLSGSAIGYGVNLGYSFKQGFPIKNKNFQMNVGVGYFRQKFDLTRPFNYSSQIYIGFYTAHYIYHCFQISAGLTYKYPLSEKFSLMSSLTYNWLNSFRQDYTPTRRDFPTEIRRSQINFGNTVILATGLQRSISKRMLFDLNILVPVYTKWRNDKIFDDDPSTFSHPKFSMGTSLSVRYRLYNKLQP